MKWPLIKPLYNYRFGLSPTTKTKELMKKRDWTRASIKTAIGVEKQVLMTKY